MTISEKLFENFCEQNKLTYSKIEEDNVNRSPDYFLKIGDYQIIVEVTEFKLNEEEKEQLSELRKKRAVAHWSS